MSVIVVITPFLFSNVYYLIKVSTVCERLADALRLMCKSILVFFVYNLIDPTWTHSPCDKRQKSQLITAQRHTDACKCVLAHTHAFSLYTYIYIYMYIKIHTSTGTNIIKFSRFFIYMWKYFRFSSLCKSLYFC